MLNARSIARLIKINHCGSRHGIMNARNWITGSEEVLLVLRGIV
jgi:hypothetical protein